MRARVIAFALAVCPAALASAVVAGRAVDADTGQPVPCTVAIRTSSGELIADHPSFRGAFRSAGLFEKEVPAGRTRVVVSRGFDYIAEAQEMDLDDGERRELIFKLRRRTPLRAQGWRAGDNHVHMIHGERTIEVDFDYVALAARAEGLDYLSLSQDWNLAEKTPEALELACRRASTADFRMTWNLEAPKNFWRGDVSHCAGHGWTLAMRGRTHDGRDAIRELLALSAWDYESHKPPVPNFEMHALIHSLGGIVSYTHPHRWWWGKWGGKGGFPVEERKKVSNMAAELPFDTVAGPTYDTIDIMMQPEEQETNRRALELWFLLLNRGYRIAGTTSSDTTFDRPGGGVPGKVRIYTLADPEPAAIAAAMKQGRNFVTSGPLIVLEIGGHGIGDVVRAAPDRKLAVRIQAWPSGAIPQERLRRVELIRNGEVLRAWEPDAGMTEFSMEIVEDGTAWYIARCDGSTDGQVAITNPIYFEGDDYRAPAAEPARVNAVVRDAAGTPLDGEVEVLRMEGTEAVRLAEHPFRGGEFKLTVPAVARLRVRARGYQPQTRSIFMDFPPLLDQMLNMTDEQLSDWSTFETARRLLRDVRLEFRLQAAQGGSAGL
jgi:hypothetical protein